MFTDDGRTTVLYDSRRRKGLMNYLKEWLEDRIEKYEEAFKDADINTDMLYEYAGLDPETLYELGRYDALIEIMDLLEKYGIND